MNRRTILLLLIDSVFVVLSFYLAVLIKGNLFSDYVSNHLNAILAFLFILLVVSLYFNKYIFREYNYYNITKKILKSHFVSLALLIMLIYIFRVTHFSRKVVLLTAFNVTVLDIIVYNVWVILKQAHVIPDDLLGLGKIEQKKIKKIAENIDPVRQQQVKDAILGQYSQKFLSTIEENINIYSEKTVLLFTKEILSVTLQPKGLYNNYVNLQRVNNLRFINKFFEAVNNQMPNGGTFVCLAETTEQRKRRLLAKYPPVINKIYYFFDFILKRVFPKFNITKRLYFFLTKGANRVISLAEFLGRLYSCGFSVINDIEIDGLTLVVAQKVGEPSYDMEPTYGPLIRLRRVGKNGKLIKVFKFRTMHPYSEYLQEYVYNKYKLQDGGKFKNDFRVTTLGRLMRKLWIDEWPMFLNVLKGEMKIVGVRPLSKHYFSLYSNQLQERRVKYKPGLVPPFYVDNPKTIDEIMDSENKYLDSYDKHPLLTDIRYFFMSFYNIIFRNLRSN